MTRSSATVGILIAARLDGLDIVLYLSSVSAPEADDPPDPAAIHKRHEVKDSCLRASAIMRVSP
jgi:hypothetical protein